MSWPKHNTFGAFKKKKTVNSGKQNELRLGKKIKSVIFRAADSTYVNHLSDDLPLIKP
jgi:hypothetical protein